MMRLPGSKLVRWLLLTVAWSCFGLPVCIMEWLDVEAAWK
jgi:hypothetical protein